MALFKKKQKPQPTAGAEAISTLAQQAMAPPKLPNEDDPNILDAIEAEDRKMRKRMGRASTLIGGEHASPMTAKQTLVGGGY